ncbi:protein BatD [Neolewinella aurantiaca]|uniref:Protein BatD n=1 Tax=Neolewinella aurantiaca TaxID=2602767 RepID=A0A5C7FAS0_9BACT|nr:BatD family protein [Neolewinella aurantiaca]TXF87728.1 protein BatD [Neolewinella aurantiaca]
MRPFFALLIVLCTCVGAPKLAAQHQDITFVAEVSKTKMLQNSTLEFKLTLNNAQGNELTPPKFDNFIVLRGPMRSLGTSIINGVGTSYLSYSWQLQPKRTGKLAIGPASIRASGRTYRTNSKSVDVLEVDDAAAAGTPDDFLRAELTTDTAFVGQQIILNLNLYSTTNIISRNLVQEPSYDGFYAQPRRQYDGRPRSIIENGREYQRRTLLSIALFPTKSGRITITPYRMVLGALRYRGNSSYSRRFTEQIPLNTDTIYVDVSELPQPRPDNFSGGVGEYRMQVQADRDRMTTDDALTLRITVTGEGDIERLETFPPVSEADWNIYDPDIISEEFLDSPTGMLGRKIFEYKVVPKRAGVYNLRPEMHYFDVDSARYVVHAPTNFNITVAAGSGNTTYEIDTTTTEEAKLSLLPVTDLPAGRTYGSSLPGQPLYWGLFLLPLLFAGGLIGWQRYRSHLDNRDPVELARERAARAAKERLKSAKIHLDKVEPRAFYDAIEGSLLGYLRDKFQLPVADLTRRNIREKLTSAGASATLTDRYDQLLQRCEMALYAGQDKADDLAAAYKTATELIADTERQTSGEF